MHDTNASINVENLLLKINHAATHPSVLHASQQYIAQPAYESMQEHAVEKGSLREAAAFCSSKKNGVVHVGAAIMPDYLNAHYDPYSSILNRGTNTAGSPGTAYRAAQSTGGRASYPFVVAAILYNTLAVWHTSDTR